MNTYQNEVSYAEILIRQGRLEQARKLLIAIVDSNPKHGQAWFLLSRVAQTNEQRIRFLRNAIQLGFLTDDVEIDPQAIQHSISDNEVQVPIDLEPLQSDTMQLVLVGGFTALAVVSIIGFGIVLFGGSITFNLPGLLGLIGVVFMLGAIVAIVVTNDQSKG